MPKSSLVVNSTENFRCTVVLVGSEVDAQVLSAISSIAEKINICADEVQTHAYFKPYRIRIQVEGLANEGCLSTSIEKLPLARPGVVLSTIRSVIVPQTTDVTKPISDSCSNVIICQKNDSLEYSEAADPTMALVKTKPAYFAIAVQDHYMDIMYANSPYYSFLLRETKLFDDKDELYQTKVEFCRQGLAKAPFYAPLTNSNYIPFYSLARSGIDTNPSPLEISRAASYWDRFILNHKAAEIPSVLDQLTVQLKASSKRGSVSQDKLARIAEQIESQPKDQAVFMILYSGKRSDLPVLKELFGREIVPQGAMQIVQEAALCRSPKFKTRVDQLIRNKKLFVFRTLR